MAKGGSKVVPARQPGTGKGKGRAGGQKVSRGVMPSGGKSKSRYAQG